jgi:hypothetical protein
MYTHTSVNSDKPRKTSGPRDLWSRLVWDTGPLSSGCPPPAREMLNNPPPPQNQALSGTCFLSSCTCFSALHGSALNHAARFYMFFYSAKEQVNVLCPAKLFFSITAVQQDPIMNLEYGSNHWHRFRRWGGSDYFSIEITPTVKKVNPACELLVCR